MKSNESLSDSATDIEKSELLARLDEMKRAIDGYKEYKLNSQNTSRV